jgi:hypothetical protein
MNMETVYRAYDLTEAELVRSRLETAGFHPFIADEFVAQSFGGHSMARQGVRVQVPEAEVADARELLASTDSPSE